MDGAGTVGLAVGWCPASGHVISGRLSEGKEHVVDTSIAHTGHGYVAVASPSPNTDPTQLTCHTHATTTSHTSKPQPGPARTKRKGRRGGW